MTIKSDKEAFLPICITLALFSAIWFWLAFEPDTIVFKFPLLAIIWLGLACCMVLYCILSFIALARTIELSANGCTVSLFCWSRRYSWNDLSVTYLRYIFKFHPHIVIGDCWANGAVTIMPKHFNKPRWVAPRTYCSMRHPFQVMYLYFREDDYRPGYEEYVVDRTAPQRET